MRGRVDEWIWGSSGGWRWTSIESSSSSERYERRGSGDSVNRRMRYYYSIFNESTKIESHPQFYFFVLFFFANNICCYRRGVYKRTLFGCYYLVTGNSVKGMRRRKMLNIGLVMYTQEKLSFPVVVYSPSSVVYCRKIFEVLFRIWLALAGWIDWDDREGFSLFDLDK